MSTELHPVVRAYRRWASVANLLPAYGAQLRTLDKLAAQASLDHDFMSTLPGASTEECFSRARLLLATELVARAGLEDAIARSFDGSDPGLEDFVRRELRALGQPWLRAEGERCEHCGSDDCTTADYRALHPNTLKCCPDCTHAPARLSARPEGT